MVGHRDEVGCRVYSGVVEEEGDEDGASTKLASSVWYKMRNAGRLRDDIDVVFARVRPRHDVTVDNVIECTLYLSPHMST